MCTPWQHEGERSALHGLGSHNLLLCILVVGDTTWSTAALTLPSQHCLGCSSSCESYTFVAAAARSVLLGNGLHFPRLL